MVALSASAAPGGPDSAVGMQLVAGDQDVMERGQAGERQWWRLERPCGPDADPGRGIDAPQQDKKDGGDLRRGVQFAEDAPGPEIANAGGDVEHGPNQQDGNIRG